MNLTELKAAAETAKTSPAELELWQMEISPDDVLRLVEVAIRAKKMLHLWYARGHSNSLMATIDSLEKHLEGIEP